MEEEKNIQDKIMEKIEPIIERTLDKDITAEDLNILGKLVDIHKDLKNEEYWERKVDFMNYGNYGNYGNNYGNYGRYNGRSAGYDTYGRRGVDSKYRGYGNIERMSDEYGRYQDSRERYGAGQETDKSFHYMLEALEDFIKVLNEEADSQQQKQMLMETLQRSMM